MIIGILLNVSFVSQNLDVNFPHWKDEDQPNKSAKKGDDKSAAAIVNSV